MLSLKREDARRSLDFRTSLVFRLRAKLENRKILLNSRRETGKTSQTIKTYVGTLRSNNELS